MTLLFVSIFGMIIYCARSINDDFKVLMSGTTWPHLKANSTDIKLEYIFLSLVQFYMGLNRIRTYTTDQGIIRIKYWRIPHAIMHLGIGGLGFYIAMNYGYSRLHHDFIGLLVWCVSLRPSQTLGLFYIIDEMLYHYATNRGPTDFSNIVMNYWQYILPALLVSCGIELLTKFIRYRVEKTRDIFGMSLTYSPINIEEP